MDTSELTRLPPWPLLLASTPVARVREVGREVEALVLATGDLGADERARLDEVIDLFGLPGKGSKAVRPKSVRA